MRWPAISAGVGGGDAGGDAASRASARMRAAIGLSSVVLVERADGADRLVEQLDLRREGVAEEAGDAQRHVDARAAELGQRDDLVAGDAPARRFPHRPRADERQRLGDVVAAGAHVGGAPGGEAERLGIVADDPGSGGAAGLRPTSGRGSRRWASAPCGCRASRNCGPSAARRAGRASARRRGRAPRSGRPGRLSSAAISSGPQAPTAPGGCGASIVVQHRGRLP